MNQQTQCSTFQVIPVIDLMAGGAVAAIRGNRADYQPLDSPLGRSDEPAALAAALVRAVSSPTLYLADLDAITGGAVQTDVIAAIAARIAPCELWVDAGARHLDAVALPGTRTVPVIGTETLESRAALEAASRSGRPWILSIDTREGRSLGSFAIDAHPDLWPRRIIVMTLERVGSRGGPAIDTIAALAGSHPGRMVYAAGGVRDRTDLDALAAAGAAGALVATAIHQGTLGRDGGRNDDACREAGVEGLA